MEYNAKLDAALKALEPDMIETLQRWIRVPSVRAEKSAENAPFGAEVRRALDVALADIERLGMKPRDIDGYCCDAEIGEGEESLAVLAHLDVVPEGDGWDYDPYGAEIVDGKMYGRGTGDDKGPAVAALFAMKAILDAGIELKGKKCRLILGCDEECGMKDLEYYEEKVGLPDMGFSPDAEFPLINTEKGIVQMKLNGEVADERLISIACGTRPNVVPGTAVAVLAGDWREQAADCFPDGQPFVQNDPTGQYSKYGFQTHDQRCWGGFHILLANDLQRVGNGHGKHTGITQRKPAGKNIIHVRRFGKGHHNAGENRAYQTLNAVEPKPVQIACHPVNQCDLNRKEKGTDQKTKVTDVDLRHTHTAEQIQSHNSNSNTDPCGRGGHLPEKQTQNRNQNNVHGCNKACFACSSIYKSHLLQPCCYKERNAAYRSGFPQMGICPLREVSLLIPVKKPDYRKQEHYRQKASDGLESKGFNIVHAHTLGNKGGAPNHGRSEQTDAALKFLFHVEVPFIGKLFGFAHSIAQSRRSVKKLLVVNHSTVG